MILASLYLENQETAAIRTPGGFLPITKINFRHDADWPVTLSGLIESGRLDDLKRFYAPEAGASMANRFGSDLIPVDSARYAPLYRNPPKIWGIGLNYADHARDLDATAPTLAPGSFMKPATTLIGHGDPIEIPLLSHKTTAEAELGVIIAKRCKDVPVKDWLSVVAGFTPVIDMTAEDILRQNPRFLTLSKSFDTFFGFGPELVTPDEIPDVFSLEIETIINGRIHARNTVSQMTFTPDRLVAFHSQVMTLLAGDIISTGTPGAAVIAHGDRMKSRITGFTPLENPVVDLKNR